MSIKLDTHQTGGNKIAPCLSFGLKAFSPEGPQLPAQPLHASDDLNMGQILLTFD
jgi:hypothetical protein